MYPKDIQNAPDNCFTNIMSKHFTEYSILRNWMSQWLEYVRWYYAVLSSYQCTLEEALSGPVVCKSYYRKSTDENLVRFGKMYYLYNKVSSYAQQRDQGWALPHTSRFGVVTVLDSVYIQGGQYGTDSLVLFEGLPSIGQTSFAHMCPNQRFHIDTYL